MQSRDCVTYDISGASGQRYGCWFRLVAMKSRLYISGLAIKTPGRVTFMPLTYDTLACSDAKNVLDFTNSVTVSLAAVILGEIKKITFSGGYKVRQECYNLQQEQGTPHRCMFC